MTYLEELKNRYKEARKRMEKYAIREKPPVINFPPPMPQLEEEEESKPQKPGLISEKAEKEIVYKALNVAAIHAIPNHSQAYRIADEILNSPRLPPLPGLVLNEAGAVRWMRIMHAVAKSHGIAASEIMGQSREKHVVTARFEVFYRMRIDLAMSYTKIGKIFRRDHTSIIHGVNKIRKKLLDEIGRQENYKNSLAGTHLSAGEHSSL